MVCEVVVVCEYFVIIIIIIMFVDVEPNESPPIDAAARYKTNGSAGRVDTVCML